MLIALDNSSLVCCWNQAGRWQQRVVAWPDGVCRDGVPLQRMEALELLVESSELEIKVVVEKKDDEPAQAAVARTQLTLKLSFYDLARTAGPPEEGSTSTPS